ncbi:hypothetical protein ACHWQZ_G017324 [Mnemiopsis leidyi]
MFPVKFGISLLMVLFYKSTSGERANALIRNQVSGVGYIKVGEIGEAVTCTTDETLATRFDIVDGLWQFCSDSISFKLHGQDVYLRHIENIFRTVSYTQDVQDVQLMMQDASFKEENAKSNSAGRVSFEACNYENNYIIRKEEGFQVELRGINYSDGDEKYASWTIVREPQTGERTNALIINQVSDVGYIKDVQDSQLMRDASFKEEDAKSTSKYDQLKNKELPRKYGEALITQV